MKTSVPILKVKRTNGTMSRMEYQVIIVTAPKNIKKFVLEMEIY
jgi:hypothetical protein